MPLLRNFQVPKQSGRVSHRLSGLLKWCSIQTKPRGSILQTHFFLIPGRPPQPLDFSNHQLLPYLHIPVLDGTQVHLWSFLPPTEFHGIPEKTHPAEELQSPPSFQGFLPKKGIKQASQSVMHKPPGWGDGSVKPLLSQL